MKVSAFSNGQVQSNRPNFSSRAIIIENLRGGITIKPEDLGLAGRCLGDFKEGLTYVGILNKGVEYAEYAGDFTVVAGVKDSSAAQDIYNRVNTLLDMAQKTDGPPIRVDGNFNRIS